MRVLLGIIAAVVLLLGMHAVSAEDKVLFPDANGKMVPTPISHTYEQCIKNGRHLGYSDSDSHTWCTQHCDGKICK
jgi:hypothetical protein